MEVLNLCCQTSIIWHSFIKMLQRHLTTVSIHLTDHASYMFLSNVIFVCCLCFRVGVGKSGPAYRGVAKGLQECTRVQLKF